MAAKRAGPITHIGLSTYVDPREQGGKCTSPSQPDAVHLVYIGDREQLWYPAPKSIDVALLRGTTADLDGNISFEREAFYADSLYQVLSMRTAVMESDHDMCVPACTQKRVLPEGVDLRWIHSHAISWAHWAPRCRVMAMQHALTHLSCQVHICQADRHL